MIFLAPNDRHKKTQAARRNFMEHAVSFLFFFVFVLAAMIGMRFDELNKRLKKLEGDNLGEE